ncbi:S8 family serine peptidase [Ornithinimicrobium sp. LYQ121]|uniref:S8 family serine peptidase n=1 Tax=Ornithinimicrobium sp. LYQ121 TaxID=3378801 RepID=UPI0038553611
MADDGSQVGGRNDGDEARPDAEMPSGQVGDDDDEFSMPGEVEPDAASGMPTDTMSGMDHEAPDAVGAAGSSGMPSGGVDSGGSEMPSGGGDMGADEAPEPVDAHAAAANAVGDTAELEEVDDGYRFGSGGDEPPAEYSQDMYEPGVVAVEFLDQVRPEIVAGGGDSPPEIASGGVDDVSELNQILRENNLESAESSFLVSEEQLDADAPGVDAEGEDLPTLANFVTLHFPAAADTRAIADQLDALPEVARAIPMPRALPPLSPLTEPLVGSSSQLVVNPATGMQNQWYIFRCGVNRAWANSSGNGVVVADIDWGYRTSHQDLAPRFDMSRAFNSFDGGTNVTTGGSASHGTAVMGIAGGAVNNLGMAGIAHGASLWPVQADSGPGTPLGGDTWARAIDWVRTTSSGGRRKVIILEVQTGSFGNYEMVPAVNAAIRTAIAAGVVVCVAAGNGNRDAGLDDQGRAIPETGSILVGATEYHATENRRASFSNFGPRITVSAPGDSGSDLTCGQGSNTAYRNGFGGTSGATPKVAGVAALMLELNPSLTHGEARTILRNTGTATVTAPDRPIGTFLNADAAVRAAARPRVSGPAVSWGASRLDVFGIGTDRATYHKWWGGSWGPSLTGYEYQGGVCTSRPEVASWGPNRLDVFVLGTDRALYHKWWNGSSWGPSLTGWESLGGVCTSPPKVVSWGPNRLDVFVLGTDRALYHKWWDGNSWGPSLTGWERMGGICTEPPEVVAWGPNRLDVFVVGTDKALYHKWWNGSSWGPSLTGYERQGGVCTSPAKAVAWGPNRLDVFVLGTDKALYHKWWNGSSWGPSLTGYERQGGVCTSPPEAVAWGPNRLDVFVLGTDRALYHKWWNGSSWGPSLTGYERQGGVCTSPPRVVSWGPNRLDVFVRGTDRALYHKWWNGSSWGPSLTGYEYQGGVLTDF